MLRFPQISRVFAEPLARKLIVQSSDDAPYPIALCFEVCIGRHVRLRYIAGNDEADKHSKMVYEKLSRCQPVDRRNHRRDEPIYRRLYLDGKLLPALRLGV